MILCGWYHCIRIGQKKEESNMEKKKLSCPAGHGEMKLTHKKKHMTFKGVDIDYPVGCFVCPTCGLEAATLTQGADIQRSMADAYRKKVGLMTGSEIVESRKRKNLSQKKLANLMKIGIASIKRWETGIIQSKSMNKMLLQALSGESCGDLLTGNRSLSIPRIKLALRNLEKVMEMKILKENDRMLYAAKYMWYIDMEAYRESGQSVTGATYAALPMGPQLNNYKDLVAAIIKAPEKQAEPLTEEEKLIIEKVACAFPSAKKVFDASHREVVWKEKSSGQFIPYADAFRLTEL
jgi:putative zinc finger/helix-turn-helix YgiT family protein